MVFSVRFLVLSDTHGHLSIMNELVKEYHADIVLHCGDFGFMTADRLPMLPDRELSLLIWHSLLPKEVRKQAWKMPQEEKIETIRKHQLMGEFDLFKRGEIKFKVPVYAIWGNHEDNVIVNQLLTGEIQVPNLQLITETSNIVFEDWVQLVGIGGNFIPWTFFDRQRSRTFYPQMNFLQWIQLLKHFPEKTRNQKQLWMLTHVSPGKQPLLELFSLYFKPTCWFSGHMGSLFPHQYSLLTYLDDHQFAQRIEPTLTFFKNLWQERLQYWRLWYWSEELLNEPETKFSTFEKIPSDLRQIFAFKPMKKYLTLNDWFKQGSSSHQLAATIQKIFAQGIKQFPKAEGIPTKDEIKFMEQNLRLFELPFSLPSTGYDPYQIMTRSSAMWMKKTSFFNLPEASSKSGIIIDANPSTEELKIQSFGRLPSVSRQKSK
jgi:predicted phosphodiesterase